MVCRRPVFKDLMQHVVIPGRGAVYPPEVQFTPRKIFRYNIYSNNFSDATGVELSEYSNIAADVR
jgi:hypothetical protein